MTVQDVVAVNGTTLYYEMQGTGPALLCIAGTTGDAGHFVGIAARLADEFTVVAYDRRGNSRSPAPEGWSQTSVSEQADDAAALVQALQLAPAAVFASDAGGRIGLDLLMRFPHLLRGVILHDPVLPSVLHDAQPLTGAVQTAIQRGFQEKGLSGGVEGVFRYVAGDAAVAAIPPQTFERMLRNAPTIFTVERSRDFANWCPAEEALAAVAVPVALLVGRESPGFFGEMAAWLARRLRIAVDTAPGGHAAYFDRATELAEALRSILRGWSSHSPSPDADRGRYFIPSPRGRGLG
jgi:pimeloyl-ACP methyl ester carboxylesterase